MNAVFRVNLHEAISVLESLTGLEAEVREAAGMVAAALNAGGKLLACGNGGSAAEAAHLTTEFMSRFDHDRRPYPAICLNVHGGDLTAIANDYHFDEIFSRQVEALAGPADVLVAFSSSGNSENVSGALQTAKRRGVHSIAVLGRDGGRCAGLANVELIVSSCITARIQEAHQFLLHNICELAETQLTEKH